MKTACFADPDIATYAETSTLRPAGVRLERSDQKIRRRFVLPRAGFLLACGAIGVVAAVAVFARPDWFSSPGEVDAPPRVEAPLAPGSPGSVAMSQGQQQAVGLKVERAEAGTAADEVKAPGRIVADQEHFAFITARAPGVVRSVAVNIGQEVHAGDVLATIDSPEVGVARLDLRTQTQLLEVAKTEADWQQDIYTNTLELIKGLKRGDAPDAIQKQLEDRPVGAGRERLMTAYSQYRLAAANRERANDLYKSEVVALGRYQQATAAYDTASGSYQALLDSTGYEARLVNLRAQQALRQAKTAVSVARERLKILGVGLEDSTLDKPVAADAVDRPNDAPLSTYALTAPFDGTILDRELIVPGVSVDLTSRLFTIADLSTVWLEVNVSEGDFGGLTNAPGGEVRFGSPAYPGRDFSGRVLYRGDLVDEASRSVKLLAVTLNADRLLKPGMFVDVTVRCPGGRKAAHVPDSALLTGDDGSFVFVRTASERFERRAVMVGGAHDGAAAVVGGLEPGEEVVVEGASKLEAKADAAAEGRNG